VNKEADRIIENCRRELNDERRYKMLERFQEIIIEEQPYTFLFVPLRLVAYDKRIQNVKYKLIGPDRDRWWVPLDKQKHKD
jgi:peptide/nickel transport system substrate-binding protein